MDRSPDLRRIFIQTLMQRLQDNVYNIVSRANPTNFQEFKRALIIGTAIIRPRTIIEANAHATIQQFGESPLEYFYRIQDLIKEYEFAIDMEEMTDVDRNGRKRRFRAEMLRWLPSGLNLPWSSSARTRTFNSFDEFKQFLQGEKDLEQRRSYCQNQTSRGFAQLNSTFQGMTTPSIPSYNMMANQYNGWNQFDDFNDGPSFSDAWKNASVLSGFAQQPCQNRGTSFGGTDDVMRRLCNEFEMLRMSIENKRIRDESPESRRREDHKSGKIRREMKHYIDREIRKEWNQEEYRMHENERKAGWYGLPKKFEFEDNFATKELPKKDNIPRYFDPRNRKN
jgi:hypothetical protein